VSRASPREIMKRHQVVGMCNRQPSVGRATPQALATTIAEAAQDVRNQTVFRGDTPQTSRSLRRVAMCGNSSAFRRLPQWPDDLTGLPAVAESRPPNTFQRTKILARGDDILYPGGRGER
jgi:hypothetical protein